MDWNSHLITIDSKRMTALSVEFGTSIQQVKNALTRLVKEQFITKQGNSVYRIGYDVWVKGNETYGMGTTGFSVEDNDPL